MKYKIIAEKIREDYKKLRRTLIFAGWIDFVDGKIVDFKNDEDITQCDDFFIYKSWCRPVEEKTSKESIIIDRIKSFCKKEMDNSELCISKYNAYLEILNIINESEEKTND